MKTYVFDASALFAYAQRTPSGPKVAGILKEALSGRVRVLMSAVNYGECYGRILRDSGPTSATNMRATVYVLPIELVDATPQAAVAAADAKIFYKLHYADSFAAGLTLQHKATLVTSDSDFRALGHAISVTWLKP